MEKQKLKQAIDAALEAYKRLDQALDAQDWRKIGAAMFELKRTLEEIQKQAG